MLTLGKLTRYQLGRPLSKRGASVRKATIALSATLFIIASVISQDVVFADTTLCTGYSACNTASYTDHGYGANNSTSYWGADPGHNCTNYAAYLETINGVTPPFNQGNAGQWYTQFSSYYPENTTPAVGSVAWWSSTSMPTLGHVAYVEAVGSGSITISEDAYGGDFDWKIINTNSSIWPDGFIHFKDLSSSSMKKVDLVVHNPTTSTYALATSTGSSFSGVGNSLTGWDAGDWVGVGDFNKDGKADIVVHEPSSNAFNVALSYGSGFSGSGTWYSGWSKGDWAGVGDFNKDGYADIVVHDPATNKFNVLLNTQHGGFTASGTWYSGWSVGDWAAVADVNGDGWSDIVVHDGVNNKFNVLKNSTNAPSFIASGTWLSGWSAGDWVGVGDFDKNGKADLVVHDPSTNNFNVALSTGTAFSGHGTWYSGWSVGDWAQAADVNGDGWTDIVVHDAANSKFNVLINSTNAPSFHASGTWLTGWSAGDWAGSGDVNGQ